MNSEKIPTEVLKYELRNLQIKVAEESRSSYLTFVKKVWPDFIAGNHHKIFAQKLNSNFEKTGNEFLISDLGTPKEVDLFKTSSGFSAIYKSNNGQKNVNYIRNNN